MEIEIDLALNYLKDILQNVESFSQGVEQSDDIGCLIVQLS